VATVNKGMHLAGGQFYLAVQEQLEDLKRHILAKLSGTSPASGGAP